MALLLLLFLASGALAADAPIVQLAGYQPTAEGQELFAIAPDAAGVEVLYEGLSTGVSLVNQGRGLHSLPLPGKGPATQALLSLSAGGAQPWPFLTVEQGFNSFGCLRQVNENGFGSSKNHYSWAMVAFKGHLYVGTLNGEAGLATIGLENTVFNPDGTEVWRYDGQSWELSAERGFRNNPDCFGVRNLVVHEDKLYAGTANLEQGCEVWESSDGMNWTPISLGGFGDPLNASVRGMYSHDGVLYVGTENSADGCELWAWDGTEWTNLVEGGFGSTANRSIAQILFWQDRLWLFLWNFVGYEIYTLDVATGDTQKRVGFGGPVPAGHGDNGNQGVLSTAIYNGNLYVGTVNVLTGADLYRTSNGRSWTQLVDRGFDYPKQAYIWRMKEYRGKLYLGCYTLGYQQTTFQEAGRMYVMDENEEFTQLVGPEGTLAPGGIVGNINYGFRTLEVFRDRLFTGTAQCFFCDVKRPGTQVWELDVDCRSGAGVEYPAPR